MTAAPPLNGKLTPEQHAAAAYLGGYWGGTWRHKAACALAGGLLRQGLGVEAVERVVEAVAEAAGDEEIENRVATVKATAEKLKDKDNRVTGFPALAKLLGKDGENIVREFRRKMGLVVTVDKLAAHKGLPADYLHSLGLHDLPDGVGIPYRDAGARTVAVKQRTALAAKAGSYWSKGVPLLPYGEDRLDEGKAAGYRVLVEGESDCWALWHHQFPALGIPGADTVQKALALGHVAGVGRLYVFQEPDSGGAEFVRNVANRVAELGWVGELLVVRLEGVKDPSELHQKRPELFREHFQHALDRATTAPLPGKATEPWGPIIPLGTHPPAPFPLDVFVRPVRDVVEATAKAMPCPIDLPAGHALAALAVAIGNTRQVKVKTSWYERARLWLAVVCRPGSKKSPAAGVINRPIRRRQKQLRQEFKEEMARYEGEMAEYQEKKKAWAEACRKDKKAKKPKQPKPPAEDGEAQAPTEGDEPEAAIPEKPVPPKEPVEHQLITSDTTREALVGLLENNPRGLSLYRDELAGWARSQNQYKGGKGDDKQFWLSMWSGEGVYANRRDYKVFVDDPFAVVSGNLPPEVLGELNDERGREDGFIHRILFLYPEDRRGGWSEFEPDPDVLDAYQAFMDQLFALQMERDEDGEPRPRTLKLTIEGRQRFAAFVEALHAEMGQEDFPEPLLGPWAKFEGYCVRLALILHVCRFAHGETDQEDVDADSVARAVRLVEYLKVNARRVYPLLQAAGKSRLERDTEAVLDWMERNPDTIRQQSPPAFAWRKVRHDLHHRFEDDDQRLEKALEALERRNYLQEIPQERNGATGRRPKPSYRVNPAVWCRNARNARNDPTPGAEPSQNGYSEHFEHFDTTPESGGVDLHAGRPEEGGPDGGEKGHFDHFGTTPARETCVPPGGRRGTSVPTEGPDGGGAESPEMIEMAAGVDATFALVRTPADLSMVLAALEQTRQVGLDLETTGLNPRTDRVRLLTVDTDTTDAEGRFTYLIDAFVVDPAPLFEALADKEIITHNGAFDLGFLARLGFAPGTVHDTMLASQLLHGTRKGRGFHSLAECVGRELGRTLDKAAQARSDWSGSLTAEQLRYAAEDAAILMPLHNALAAKLRAAGLDRVAAVEGRCLPSLVWAGGAGVAFDKAAWQALVDEAEAEAKALGDRLDALAPPTAKAGLFGTHWDSPEQVKAAFQELGITLDSTDDEHLAAVNHPLAETLRDYRSAKKRSTTYGKDWLKHVADDGRVYAGWRQIGADSGRMACREPNLQNLPRDPRYRRCFVAPPGRVLVKADYSQVELRIAAKIASEEKMVAAYQHGDDLHALTARMVLGRQDVTKADRQLAKAVNFGLLYGMGWKGFRVYARTQYNLDLTAEQAQQYRAAFFRAYPGLARWHQKVRATHALETRTLTGRRRLLTRDNPDTWRLNTPVQGTGADGLKLALALLWERRAEVPGAFPVLAVHDEIVVECAAEQAEAVEAWLRTAMVEGMAPLIEPVPVEVEVTVGTTWGG